MLVVSLAMLVLQQPTIVSRAEWGAAPPILPMKPHQIRFITIHHAGVATKKDVPNKKKLQDLQKWCQREDRTSFARVKPAWPDIPYHYYIFADGEIYEARQAGFVGDTNTTYDPTGHLLICLEGSLSAEQPTEAQLRSMQAMTAWAARKYNVLRSRIGAHQDYAQTDCPGKNVLPFVRRLKTSF